MEMDGLVDFVDPEMLLVTDRVSWSVLVVAESGSP
jgi:hypothetical protein